MAERIKQIKGKTKQCKKGMIHSFESFGALDGPGIRFVVFLEGCPLRCVYCHNRDMLDMKDYLCMSAEELVNDIIKYKPYFGSKGGVTFSGGDPVFQPEFLLEVLKLCKNNGIHTTVDTSLFTSRKVIDSIFPYVDLFMVSLKHFNSKIHQKLTGCGNEQILDNISYLSHEIAACGGKIGTENKKVASGVERIGSRSSQNLRTGCPKLWLRYVVLPGYTDTKDNLKALVEFLHQINFELIELLPYHTYGIYKWKKLGLKYALNDLNPPKVSVVMNIKKTLEKEGFKVQITE